jgi:hypothetical protein
LQVCGATSTCASFACARPATWTCRLDSRAVHLAASFRGVPVPLHEEREEIAYGTGHAYDSGGAMRQEPISKLDRVWRRMADGPARKSEELGTAIHVDVRVTVRPLLHWRFSNGKERQPLQQQGRSRGYQHGRMSAPNASAFLRNVSDRQLCARRGSSVRRSGSYGWQSAFAALTSLCRVFPDRTLAQSGRA